jgi:hypothetical protein
VSSKRAVRRKRCGRKVRHSEAAARETARAINASERTVGPQLRRVEPYRCPHCGQWHVGHGKAAR